MTHTDTIHLTVKIKNRYSVAHGPARWRIIYDAPVPSEDHVPSTLSSYRRDGLYPLDRFEYSYTVTTVGLPIYK